jgi:hypothetical protein
MVSLPVLAQPRPGGSTSEPAQTEDQRKAQACFQRAKELYQAGKYSEAAAQLEMARDLDPNAKDLVMNLGIVNEKLGKYDEAISYLKTYLEMEGVTTVERSKVEGMIKRIEGAKASAPPQPTAPPTASVTPTPTTPPPATTAPTEPSPRGRVDALTIGAATVAGLGLVVGTGVGIYAISARPPDGYVTGRDGSYATLQQKTNDAHSAAIVADASLGVGVVAALATAWLYFGRTKTPAASQPATGNGHVSMSAAPGKGGGVIFLGGTFQ